MLGTVRKRDRRETFDFFLFWVSKGLKLLDGGVFLSQNKRIMTRLSFFSRIFGLMLVLGGVGYARLDIDKAVDNLILVDGVFYLKAEVEGKLRIGDTWVDAGGNRAFYGEGRLPETSDEWEQLLADISLGGAAVRQFLDTNAAELLNSPYAGDVVTEVNAGLLSGTGLSSEFADSFLRDAFASVLSTPGEDRQEFDFSALDFSGYDFTGVDLRNTGLTGLQMSLAGQVGGANLSGLSLQGFQAGNRDLTNTILDGADLTGSVWDNIADFSGLSFVGANLSGANFKGRNLTGANFTGANLAGANLTGTSGTANLGGANLTGAFMNGSLVNGGNPDDFPDADWNGEWVSPLLPGWVYIEKPWTFSRNYSLVINGATVCYREEFREIWMKYVGLDYEPGMDPANFVGPEFYDETEYSSQVIPCETTCDD